jgi:8-oxo-dGTP pyrophosphatase MutT (NUDIX family)
MIRTLASRLVYANRWMTVREDDVEFADGRQGIYGIVEKSLGVGILALGEGTIHLVEQYRYTQRRRRWEMPQGAWEDRPDTDAETVMRAELVEETGLVAADVRKIGEIALANGFLRQRMHVFVARGLTPGPTQRETTEIDMVHREFPVAEFEAMMRAGDIDDASTLAAYALAKLSGDL